MRLVNRRLRTALWKFRDEIQGKEGWIGEFGLMLCCLIRIFDHVGSGESRGYGFVGKIWGGGFDKIKGVPPRKCFSFFPFPHQQ
jgi:hypothetical protein